MSFSDKIAGGLRFLKLYGQHLPMAFDALFTLPCQVMRIRGALKGDGSTVTILYVGRRRRNFHYLVRAIFDRHVVLDEVRSTLLTFRRHAARFRPLSDVAIVDIGWPYHGLCNRRGDFLEVPDWVNLSIVLEDDWDAVEKSFRYTVRHNDLKLIRRNEYHCDVTNDEAAVEHFYDEVYAPFVAERHDAEAILAPRKHVLRRARQGELLRICRGDDMVAAGVVYQEDEILFLLWMGLPAAHRKDPPKAAISALYYFAIRHAYDHGCYAVDFTGTRAFLNDGAFRFKRKWGAVLEDSFSPSSVLVRPAANNPRAALFCERIPVLARGPDGLEAVLLHTGENVDHAKVRELAKEYGCDGMERINVITLSDSEGGDETFSGKRGAECRHVRTTLEKFSSHYSLSSLRAAHRERVAGS